MIFSFQNCYQLFHNIEDGTNTIWKSIWGCKSHGRLRLIASVFPTKQVIHLRIRIRETLCVYCACEVDSVEHIFLSCPFMGSVAFLSYYSLRLNSLSSSHLEKVLRKSFDCRGLASRQGSSLVF